MNHSHNIDGPMVMGVAPRPTHFLIKKEAFIGPLDPFLTAIGQLKVDRSVADRGAITESPSEKGWKSDDFALGGRTPFRGVREEVVSDFRRAAELGVGHLIFEFPVSRGEETMDLFEVLADIRQESGV